MKQNVSEYDFIEGVMKIRPNNFTVNGLRCLYDYLIELEDSIGEEIEFDVIAICCEFSEYKDLKEISEAYNRDFMETDDIRDFTQVIECDNSIIIQDF